MTSTISTLNRRLISGNGKVYAYQGQNYYAYPTAYAYSYPLKFAVSVTVSVNSQGYPVIRFYFSYGGQTVNYDTVTLKVPVASAVAYSLQHDHGRVVVIWVVSGGRMAAELLELLYRVLTAIKRGKRIF